MYKVELIDINGEVGFIIPDEIVSNLKLTEDSILNAVEKPNGVELVVVHNDSGQ